MLQNRGFTKATTHREPNLVVDYRGEQKKGRTYQLLTAPGPIGLLSTNMGTYGVAQKFAKEKDIYLKQYHIPLEIKKISKAISRKAAEAETSNPLKYNIDEAIDIWETYKSDFREALRDNDIKTIGIDNATEIYQLICVARFGKLGQVDPFLYGPVYIELAALFKSVYDRKEGKPIKNLITIHEMKDEYKKYTMPNGQVKEMKTGRRLLDGYRKFPHIVQVNCECYKKDSDFIVKILDCRDTAQFDGVELVNEDASFETLKSLILS
ncbi:MAG: hypothetical protein ACFFDY_01120 [Candidatus Thorarchaeota archaeon]